MFNVCTNYEGDIISLAEFETEHEAEEFMKTAYVLFYADEIDLGEDIIIHPEDMFIDDILPFAEPVTKDEWLSLDELPF